MSKRKFETKVDTERSTKRCKTNQIYVVWKHTHKPIESYSSVVATFENHISAQKFCLYKNLCEMVEENNLYDEFRKLLPHFKTNLESDVENWDDILTELETIMDNMNDDDVTFKYEQCIQILESVKDESTQLCAYGTIWKCAQQVIIKNSTDWFPE
jgi:hypothetical protein